jgi:hypothetical protein
MSVNFNLNNFPVINIELSGNFTSDNIVNEFFNNWLSLYELKKDFEIILDTKNIENVSLKYGFYIASIIKKIKKNKEKYKFLYKTTIYLYDKYIYRLIKSAFLFEEPLSYVILIFINNKGDDEIEHINPYK